MMNEEQKPKRNRKANPDRITLGKEALHVLASMETQVEKAFGGMVRLKNKELTNFILEARSAELSSSELKMLKDRYFDEVRAATWALQKLKEAKERGESLKLKEILAQIQTPLVKEKSASKKVATARKNESQDPAGTVVTPKQGSPLGSSDGHPNRKVNG